MATKEQVQEAINIWQAGKDIPGKTAIVSEQSCCDMCTGPALVDCKTIQGHWGNLCLKHFHAYGVGLGDGKGQVLIWRKS